MRKALLISSALICSAAISAASAQEGGLDTIIVTAQKKQENIQQVPIAVSALSGEALANQQIDSILDMQSLAPGLQVSEAAGTARIFIRGIGLVNFAPGGEPSVAFHVDGAVISRPGAQIGPFFDLERIEVLRGPQGSLYGRNATGGSINLITRRPTDELDAYANITVGNYGLIETNGALSGPIIPGVLNARIAARTENRNGFGENLQVGQDVDDADNWAVRGSLEYVGHERFRAFLTYSHYQRDSSRGDYHALGPANPLITPPEVAMGGMIAADPRDSNSEVDIASVANTDSITLELEYDISDAVSLKSITNYFDHERSASTDLNQTPVPFFRNDTSESAEQFSEELHLIWDTPRWSGLFGLYYFDEDITPNVRIEGPPVFPNVFMRPFILFEGQQSSKSYAAFLNTTFHLTDELSFTAGVRYSKDEKEEVGSQTIPTGMVIPTNRTLDTDAWTPKFVIEYEPTNALLFYGTVSRGYKAGVINIGNAGPAVFPEFVWNYEAGVKSRLFDNRVQANASVFYTEISDLQVQRPISGTLITINAAEARTKGVELETKTLLGGGFSLDFNGAYVDADFKEFLTENTTFAPGVTVDLAGNPLPNSPKWHADIALAYEGVIGDGWTVNGRVQGVYTDKRWFNEFRESISFQDETFQLNANLRIGNPGGRYYVNIWGRNLTDEFIISHINVTSSAIGHMRLATFMQPRTFGATFGFEF